MPEYHQKDRAYKFAKDHFYGSYIRIWCDHFRKHYDRLYIIDLFAGAGKSEKSGTYGSPLIALNFNVRKLANGTPLLSNGKGGVAKLFCKFAEIKHFEQLSVTLRTTGINPALYEVHCGDFTDILEKWIEEAKQWPTLIYADPDKTPTGLLSFAPFIDRICMIDRWEILLRFSDIEWERAITGLEGSKKSQDRFKDYLGLTEVSLTNYDEGQRKNTIRRSMHDVYSKKFEYIAAAGVGIMPADPYYEMWLLSHHPKGVIAFNEAATAAEVKKIKHYACNSLFPEDYYLYKADINKLHEYLIKYSGQQMSNEDCLLMVLNKFGIGVYNRNSIIRSAKRNGIIIRKP